MIPWFPTKELWPCGVWGPARQLVDPFPSSPNKCHPLQKKCLFLFIDLAALVSVEAHRNLSAGKMIFSFSLYIPLESSELLLQHVGSSPLSLAMGSGFHLQPLSPPGRSGGGTINPNPLILQLVLLVSGPHHPRRLGGFPEVTSVTSQKPPLLLSTLRKFQVFENSARKMGTG